MRNTEGSLTSLILDKIDEYKNLAIECAVQENAAIVAHLAEAKSQVLDEIIGFITQLSGKKGKEKRKPVQIALSPIGNSDAMAAVLSNDGKIFVRLGLKWVPLEELPQD